MISGNDEIAYLQRRLPAIIVVMIVFFLIVASRLLYLQVLKGGDYQKLAEEIFVREEEIVAKRGDIVDRNGILIASSRPYYEIMITPQYVQDRNKVIESLTKILPIEKDVIEEKLDAARYEAKFRPVAIAEDVPYDWVAKLSEFISPIYDEAPHLLSGVAVRSHPLREYLFPEKFSHVLGYVKEIDKKFLAKAKIQFPGVFTRGDLTGAAGVEKAYDLELKGSDGVIGRVVDARGREVTKNEDLKVLQDKATVSAKPGYTLKTTLDYDTQLKAVELFEGKKGAIVALDPRNGEIISLYSSPGFNGNRIIKNIDKKYWQKINLDEDKYLFNRALQAMYPPASTYKAVVLTAGINEGIVDPEKTVHNCRGGTQFGRRFFKCWRRGGHGKVDAILAVAQSCDVFFYKVGIELGVDRLARYAKIFGLAVKTGIELPFEQSGLIPTKEWKKRARKQEWLESEMLSVAIGQSFNLVTPLQNAVVAAMVANGGYRVIPHLGKELIHENGKVKKINFEKIKTNLAGTEGLKIVKDGMIAVVHGRGTATRLRLSPNKIAGKTGTAQVISHGRKAKKGVNTENHAWFIAFAPYDNPTIAVSVIVEHGRGGSATAAPIAMQIIDTYFKKDEVDSSEQKL